MAFKLNDKIVYRGNDNDTLHPILKRGTVTKLGKDTVWLDNHHKPEDQVYSAFLYPDSPESVAFLEEGIALTLRHKAEDAEYMTKTYKFNNELVRKGLK
jgi:hypothetical protein